MKQEFRFLFSSLLFPEFLKRNFPMEETRELIYAALSLEL